MNSKRQTIWLVSMLSLMVVLSAYYLFTDDPNKHDMTTGELHTQDIVVGLNELTPEQGKSAGTASDKANDTKASGTASDKANDMKASGTAGDKVNDTKASGTASGKANDAKATGTTGDKANDAKAAADAKAGAKETATAKTDEQVIQQIQAQGKSAQEYIITEQMKRNEQFKLSMENLIAIMTDPKKSKEEAATATNEYNAIEQRDLKLTSIEETLGQNYENVVVIEDNEKWKVVVQAPKLEKSEGASIVTLVMNELNVGPERVVVQSIAQ